MRFVFLVVFLFACGRPEGRPVFNYQNNCL